MGSCTWHLRPWHASTGLERDACVIADTGGPIAEIVLHYVPESSDLLTLSYHDLFDSLPPDVHVMVLCPSEDGADQFIADWGDPARAGGRALTVVNVDGCITLWARDRCIPRQRAVSGAPASVYVPTDNADYGDDKHNELLVPGWMAAAGLGPSVLESRLHIEGGNIVSNGRHVFLGANVLSENGRPPGSEEAFRRELAELFGRPVLLLGDPAGNVPFCHVDMYVTPVDDQTVLVADPRLAAELLADQQGASAGKGPAGSSPIVHGAGTLDAVADRLGDNGYAVIRLPCIIDPNEEWMVTYNNVLMERRDTRRVVYMPIYQIPALDETVAEVYRDLGFEVHGIDVSMIYEFGGAIRCLANVTRRRPDDPSSSGEPETAIAGRNSRSPRAVAKDAERRAVRRRLATPVGSRG
ncbi:MAG: agmatine deiminase family protein [Phycisphaerae bacterium]|nr:agmatine deiminase family protein [Phycisphaerae bacterium]